MTEHQRRQIDEAMLDSLSEWFAMRSAGYKGPHSFNDGDVSELLKRVRAALRARQGAIP